MRRVRAPKPFRQMNGKSGILSLERGGDEFRGASRPVKVDASPDHRIDGAVGRLYVSFLELGGAVVPLAPLFVSFGFARLSHACLLIAQRSAEDFGPSSAIQQPRNSKDGGLS